MSWPVALMKFLAGPLRRLDVAVHTYVVGGAVRNHILGEPIKDLDIVIDSVACGRDAAWLATELQNVIPVRTNLVTNQYGVAILTIKDHWVIGGANLADHTIEIATARKESYGGAEGKGYKPHMVEPATIKEDLLRREFTFNTLLWRFSELHHGPAGAPITDLVGTGMLDLEARVLRTPSDPDKTFSDDPTRMLRAIKFVARYGFKIDPAVYVSIQRNASKLKDMPWNAVQEILVRDILFGPKPRESLNLMFGLGLADVIGQLLDEEPGFNSGVGRFLAEAPVSVALDIHDLGWKVRSVVSFLSRKDQIHLRDEILPRFTFEDLFMVDFWQHLVKPPIDQPALFAEFGIEGKDRGQVLQIARQLVLASPDLARDPGGLMTALRLELADRFDRA